jgi:aspartate/methionine/tyrosine aminotransferase
MCGDRYRVDFDALEAAANSCTRLLLYTSPSNPLGWVATERTAAAARFLPRAPVAVGG